MISTPRIILGILALACVPVCGLMSTFASLEMVDKVNEKLPKTEQFEQFNWYAEKMVLLHREYKRLYPCGQLSCKVRVLAGLMFASLLTCAWSMGFFGK
jgi:hypothetical protein